MATIYGGDGGVRIDGTEDLIDDLYGGTGDDTIYGYGGNDGIFGGAGNDISYGGAGNDLVFGKDGDDSIYGGAGANNLFGDAGNDYFGQTGPAVRASSSMYGGDHQDFFNLDVLTDGVAHGGDGYDTLRLNWFIDDQVQDAVTVTPSRATTTGLHLSISFMERYEITTGAGNDRVTTGNISDAIGVGRGANVVNSQGGDDAVSYVTGALNRLDGGLGRDLLEVSAGSDADLTFTVSGASATDGFGSVLRGFEDYAVTGAAGDDVITLGAGRDTAFGGEGGDNIGGGAQRDRLYGEAGNDTVAGGDNSDVIGGGSGFDSLSGGAGYDTLWGGYGIDTLAGEAGNDRLHGGTADDDLAGGDGNDRLFGGKGRDLLAGDDGDDRLTGGRDNDTLTGGAGADVFILTGGDNGFDLVTDFVSGEDRIEIAAQLLQFGPGAGALDPALLASEVAVGTGAQFVLRTGMPDGNDWLVWDPNGADPAGGTYAILRFTAGVDLAAGDILLV